MNIRKLCFSMLCMLLVQCGCLSAFAQERLGVRTEQQTAAEADAAERAESFRRIFPAVRNGQGRRVPRKKKGRRIVAVLAGLICLGAAAVAYGYFGPNFLLPYKSGYVHVRSDMTASEVGDILTDKGYIASPLWFRAVFQPL